MGGVTGGGGERETTETPISPEGETVTLQQSSLQLCRFENEAMPVPAPSISSCTDHGSATPTEQLPRAATSPKRAPVSTSSMLRGGGLLPATSSFHVGTSNPWNLESCLAASAADDKWRDVDGPSNSWKTTTATPGWRWEIISNEPLNLLNTPLEKCGLWPPVQWQNYPWSSQSWAWERTGNVSSRRCTATIKSKSLTIPVASWFVCTLPLAVLTFVRFCILSSCPTLFSLAQWEEVSTQHVSTKNNSTSIQAKVRKLENVCDMPSPKSYTIPTLGEDKPVCRNVHSGHSFFNKLNFLFSTNQRIELFQIWRKELNPFSLNMTQRIEPFFVGLKELNFSYMTQRIEPFFVWLKELNFSNMTQRIEPFFFEYDAEYDTKNWTFFCMTQELLNLFLNTTQRIESYDSKNCFWMIWTFFWISKNWTFFVEIEYDSKIELFFMTQIEFRRKELDPLFFQYVAKNWTLFLEYVAKNWTLFLEYAAKNWTLFQLWLKELFCYIWLKILKIWLKELNHLFKHDCWFFFWTWHKELNLLLVWLKELFYYDSKNWTSFFEKYDWKNCSSFSTSMTQSIELFKWLNAKDWTLILKNDAKNGTFFFQYDAKNGTFFFSIWRQELNHFSLNVTQRIEPLFFECDAKSWTLVLWIWRKELNPCSMNTTQRVEPFFFGIWLKELNHLWI